MIQIAHAGDAIDLHTLLEQVLVNVEQAATGEDLVEFVLLQLVHARAARHDDGLDVEVVEGVGDAVEQHAVVGDDLLPLVVVAGGRLRIAAAQITRGQYALRADLVQHRLGGESHLAEKTLGTAARKVEHRVGILVHPGGIANHGNDGVVLEVKQGTRGFLRQVSRHGFVDEVNHLRLDRWLAGGRWRPPGLNLRQQEFFRQAVREALYLVAPADHQCLQQLDRGRIGGVEKKHRRCRAGVELLPPLLAQQVAHGDRHVAEVDIDGARVLAFVAHGTVVCHVFELVEMAQADAAACLLFIQEGLDEQGSGKDLVARRIQQVGARHVRGAYGLAFAAAQAVLD